MSDLPSLRERIGDWVEQGLCREMVQNGEADPSWWFPTSNKEMRTVNMAKAICGRCVVKDECLAWAVQHEDFGIWGGAGPRQREYLQSDRKRLCRNCDNYFIPRSHATFYCNPLCAYEAKRIRKREQRKAGPPVVTKPCAHCGETFVDPNRQKVYCNDLCRKRAQRAALRAERLKESENNAG